MTVGELLRELEFLLSDVCFSGLKNTQPALLLKLDGLRGWMEELGMPRGSALADALSRAVRACQLGEGGAAEAADRLCALEFYCRNGQENLCDVPS